MEPCLSIRTNKIWSVCLAVCILMVVVNDARYHFDKDLVVTKRKHRSPQRDWSAFYGQNFVYYDASMRYEKDFSGISHLVDSRSIIFSDLATSYYSAAYLPVYVRNVHRHHGTTIPKNWPRLLDGRKHCYLHIPENIEEFEEFVRSENRFSKQANAPMLKYVLVNNDEFNRNPRFDCFWNGRKAAIDSLEKIATKLYAGEYLILYELDKQL